MIALLTAAACGSFHPTPMLDRPGGHLAALAFDLVATNVTRIPLVLMNSEAARRLRFARVMNLMQARYVVTTTMAEQRDWPLRR